MQLIDAEPIENYEGWLDGTCLVIPKDLIYEAPTIEAEPVIHGHWMNRSAKNDYIWCECSNCGFMVENYKAVILGKSDTDYIGVKYHYCPVCGAKMSEVEK